METKRQIEGTILAGPLYPHDNRENCEDDYEDNEDNMITGGNKITTCSICLYKPMMELFRLTRVLSCLVAIPRLDDQSSRNEIGT